jgi:hypothetical protein
MLALSRKQMMVLLLVLVSFIVVLVASIAVIHATNPALWRQLMNLGPDIISHY